MAFDCVTLRAIKRADSRLRRVLVSIRCEIFPSSRRSWPCRYGRALRENKILGVHLPMKIEGAIVDPCIVFIRFCLLRKRFCKMTRLGFALGTLQLASARAQRAIRNMCVPSFF